MKLTLKRVGIILADLVTAGLHIFAAFALYPPPQLSPDPVFTLNGLGYLGLLGAYLLPIPFFQKRHQLVWWALLGYTLLTIVLWVIIGDKNFATLTGQVGLSAKIAELFLLGFLLADRPRK
ncbi:MAG TPA: hypothetical protein VMC09_14790 [Anaerolineales bacterium]|nr:hypothetical protein [Anaerolineales bacterium]